MRTFYVYILASHMRRLYVGVTRDLVRRVWQHKGGQSTYTSAFAACRLVYYETTADARAAIAREQQLKRWPRWRKERLIEEANAGWLDLSRDWPIDVRPPR